MHRRTMTRNNQTRNSTRVNCVSEWPTFNFFTLIGLPVQLKSLMTLHNVALIIYVFYVCICICIYVPDISAVLKMTIQLTVI
jgi:hypothetical protein